MKKVAVGILVRINKDNQKEWLLISPAKDFGEHSKKFYPPGGHVEEGEDEKEAVEREIAEELNIKVIAKEIIATTPGDVPNQKTYWIKCELPDEYTLSTKGIDKKEILSAGFYTRRQIEQELELWPANKTFFKEYLGFFQ